MLAEAQVSFALHGHEHHPNVARFLDILVACKARLWWWRQDRRLELKRAVDGTPKKLNLTLLNCIQTKLSD